MLKKIKHHYNNPFKLIYICVIYTRILLYKAYVLTKSKITLSGNLYVSKDVKFYQKTEIYGNGSLEIGKNSTFGVNVGGGFKSGYIEIQPRTENSKIVIGNNVAINNNAFICASNYIEIGDDVLIGRNLSMTDFEAHGTSPNDRKKLGKIGKIIIESNVWIGNNVTILKNVHIGVGCVISSGSVVLSGEYPPNSIIGGNPAKIIKQINY